ncbi:MAG: dihydropteroate synthase [Planctomycetes bacterium]|nr:dihydropteroate synthase [Planctomycetota bacterium]
MGIVNCTPDSFHAGGRSLDVASAVAHALDMVRQGADLIDVGGESTRPGAERMPAQEQIRRVVPVIRGIRERSDVAISIDTTLAEVAEAAMRSGAWIVNDVSAGLEDARLMPLVARAGAGLVLMHRRVPPGEDRYSHQYLQPPEYADVVRDVSAFLVERRMAAEQAGVPRARMLVDPGFGFGKSVEQNFAMLARLGEFEAIGVPLLVGLSRKSFLGAVSGAGDPADRLPATLAAAVQAIVGGAAVLRVHDVAEHAQLRAVLGALGRC